ncbi:hypothetical protein THAOC_14260 [Thalassiosira oceanica]|uniref:Uncharacterized protein n=1 Tax=Thalassiosira oceanica TaxID=159749 RepID=K0SIZ7_THAOC|nr:hypothetical protein THAOC_14260 [Thalassiosira oceanica]|eukprot:EJK64949.1 hypothetical protein THAOC_14260 [Thalassiosira oceanica]
MPKAKRRHAKPKPSKILSLVLVLGTPPSIKGLSKMRMRLLLPSLCLLSSTFGTLLAKVAEADGINLVDDNRLQDNEAVAPGPLQPVSRGLRRGGGLQMPTFLKLGESDNGYYYNNGELTLFVAHSCS